MFIHNLEIRKVGVSSFGGGGKSHRGWGRRNKCFAPPRYNNAQNWGKVSLLSIFSPSPFLRFFHFFFFKSPLNTRIRFEFVFLCILISIRLNWIYNSRINSILTRLYDFLLSSILYIVYIVKYLKLRFTSFQRQFLNFI